METVFFKPKEEYNNQLNPVKGYLEQITHFIATKKQITLEEAKPLAVKFFREKFKDRPIRHFTRKENGDRVVEDSTVLSYINRNVAEKNILVPTFTSYRNADTEKSILSEFIAVNVATRSKAKKEGQKAKAEGNAELADSKNNEQNNMKIRNNSVSGLFGQKACILHNPTAHSALTSITRTMTSLSNACNERLIAGNRYLPRPEDVYRSVVYESTNVNLSLIQRVVEKYGIHLPTVEETVKVLKYSSDLYFHDNAYYNKHIVPFLSKLTPYHLAAICYTGDLYHQRVFNDKLIRQILSELIVKVEPNSKLEDLSELYSTYESILMLAHGVLSESVKGLGKDYSLMNEKLIASNLLATSKNVKDTLLKYRDYFNCFYMTEKVPINSHRIRNMRRRVVVLSDTDSSCFTLDNWITWYLGEYKVTETSIAVASAITYIAGEAIVNQLAILSKSMNVQEQLLDTLAMKNEFLWHSIVPTEVSKHYYAWTVIQEGNVFKEPEIEIKGVHLKNSAVPPAIISHAKDLMTHILSTVSENRKIKLNEVIKCIIDLENSIIDSVKRGESVYLKKSKIKNEDSYAQDRTKSPYQRHLFWEDVFAPTYGQIQPPPYDVVKLPTTVTSKTKLTEWIASIQDLTLGGRLTTWLNEYNKKDLPTVYLSESYVQGSGVPKEIIDVIDIKRIVFDTTMQHRLILETLGVMLNKELLVKEQLQRLLD